MPAEGAVLLKNLEKTHFSFVIFHLSFAILHPRFGC